MALPEAGALEIDPKRAGDDKRTRIPRANAIPSPAETIDLSGNLNSCHPELFWIHNYIVLT